MGERSSGEFSDGNREPVKSASLTAPGLLFTFSGFLLLNGLLSIHVWAPSYDFALTLRPTFDFLALFLLVLLVSRVKKGAYALGLGFLSLLGSFLFFFSMGEAVTLHVYGRSFLPLVDTAYFMEFIRLLFAGESGRKTFFFAFLFSFFLIGAAAGVSAIICGAAGYLRRLRRPLPAKAILTGAVLLLALTTGLPRLPGGSLAKSVYLGFRGGFPVRETPGPQGRERAAPALATPETGGAEQAFFVAPAPPGAATPGRNVFLFIVESYGFTVFGKEEHRHLLAPFYEETEEKLESAGYTVLSRFFRSPVSGGYSWYADASLLTGTWVDSKERYDELMASRAPSAFSVLESLGYATALSAPGTLKPWPEGERFYGFNRPYYNESFGYRGPSYSFVPVPDQFAVHVIHKEVVEKTYGRPLFVLYILVSSHAPFNRIPPYVEDWDALRDGSIYRSLPTLTFDNNWFHGNEYAEGYAAAIRYELTLLADYLARFVSDETLVIIVGDHQPKYPVAGKEEPRSVPMHVLSKNGGILEPFRAAGFTEGLTPGGTLPHPRLDTFFPIFVEAAKRMRREPAAACRSRPEQRTQRWDRNPGDVRRAGPRSSRQAFSSILSGSPRFPCRPPTCTSTSPASAWPACGSGSSRETPAPPW